MNKKQEQQILDYYSTNDKYIHSKTHSNAHQTVFTKESDKYQWLVLEQKSQCEVEVRQTDSHGTITARDNYELTGNLPKCVDVERLCEGANIQIPFNADEINLIYQFGEQGKAETCAHSSAILPQIKDSDTKQIVSTTLKKLNSLSEETCAELTATTKRRKLTERDQSIKTKVSQSKGTGKTADSCRGKTAQNPKQRKGGYDAMKLSRYEQETIVNYNAGEQTATVYTRDKTVMRKLDTLVGDFPDTYKLIEQNEVSKTYSFPKSYVSYRKPRTVSTKQREWARQMMIAKNRVKKD